MFAAHQVVIKKLIVPAGNKADIWENVHGSVREGVEFVYVCDVREVFPKLSAGSGEGVKGHVYRLIINRIPILGE